MITKLLSIHLYLMTYIYCAINIIIIKEADT